MDDKPVYVRDEHGRFVDAPSVSLRKPGDRSWRQVMKSMGELTPGQMADFLEGKLAQEFRALEISTNPDGTKPVQLKELVTARVYAALLFDPNPSLLNALLDRVEGKVSEKVEHEVSGGVIVMDHNSRIVKGKRGEGDEDPVPVPT